MERIGNYQVERRVSGGGGRERYQATHCVLPRRAVIQVAEPEAALQLMREACFLEALDHPGIVRVYESGLLSYRRPWLACERIDGFTLGRMLQRDALEPADVVELVRDLAEVLAHAHRRGVVHGGLRPDRIVLTGHPRRFPVCLADWGDARAHDAGKIARSSPSDGHAAPELVRGDAIDDRADVYALGVIAYEALTGTPIDDAVPIAVDDDGSVIAAASRCPDAPRSLTALVDQMLAFDRWDRPSAAEVQLELASLSDALETHVPPDAPAPLYIRKPRWTPQLAFRELDPSDDDDGPIVRGLD
ncbi:MAG: serine/threonine-protein kinase [Acidobacteriota bacterium]